MRKREGRDRDTQKNERQNKKRVGGWGGERDKTNL